MKKPRDRRVKARGGGKGSYFGRFRKSFYLLAAEISFPTSHSMSKNIEYSRSYDPKRTAGWPGSADNVCKFLIN